MSKLEKLEELKKELEYQEKKIEVCAYGKQDLYYIEHLKYEIEKLESEIM